MHKKRSTIPLTKKYNDTNKQFDRHTDRYNLLTDKFSVKQTDKHTDRQMNIICVPVRPEVWKLYVWCTPTIQTYLISSRYVSEASLCYNSLCLSVRQSVTPLGNVVFWTAIQDRRFFLSIIQNTDIVMINFVQYNIVDLIVILCQR